MFLRHSFFALSVSALMLFAGCQMSPNVALKPGGLDVGDKAVTFSLLDSNGQPVKSSDIQPGWYLVTILYRGSWCSACQNQLLNLKDDFSKFTALHAAIVAISVDPLEDSATFNAQWRFPFPLLSDPHFEVIDAYGARHPQGHAGKDISRPSVIIVDPNGIVRYKHIGKDPTDRPTDDELLFMIQQMQQGAPKSN